MPTEPIRTLRFEGFALDLVARELRAADGEPVPMTAKAFDTLCYLVEHRGRVVSKDELLASVWAGRVVEENNLTQAVSALRRAFGTGAGDHRFVVTVPGRGYRFVADVLAGGDGPGAAELGAQSAAAMQAETAHMHQKRTASARIRRQGIVIGAVAVLALVAVVAWRQRAPAVAEPASVPMAKPAAVKPMPRTLAVLPFRSLSVDSKDELLELGLADTVITRISSSDDLRVRSLSSSQRFAGSVQDPLAAARQLGVDYIVEGTTQRHGEDVKVNARLLSVRDGSALWSGSFDEDIARVFSLQDRIAQALADALAVTVAVPAHSSPCDGRDAEAYRAYLSGQYELARPSALRTRRALDAFRRAIDLDPSCARAYAGMSYAYRILAMVADEDPQRVFPLAKAMADKALALEPDLAEAHAAQAWVRLWYDWDWAASEAAFKRSIELNPSLASAYFGYANMLKHTGRDAEASEQAKLALALDPLSPVVNAIGGWFVPDPRQAIDRSLELDPDYWLALILRGVIQIQAGQAASGLADLERARTICGDCSHALTSLGVVQARAGNAAAARAILHEMEARDREGYWPASSLATLHAALGETDAALDLLERAYRERDVRMSFLVIDMGPRWRGLAGEQRFRALMQRMALPMRVAVVPTTRTPASTSSSAAGRSSR